MAPCQKCHGFVAVLIDDCLCMNCGWRPPLTPLPTVYRETGSQCECSRQTDGLSGTCRICRYTGHAAKVKAGHAKTTIQHICKRDVCHVLCDPGLRYCPAHRPPIRVQRVRRNGPVLPVGPRSRGRINHE